MALVAPIDAVLLPSDGPLRSDAVSRYHGCAGRARHGFSPDLFLHHRLAVSSSAASKPLKKWLCSASGRSSSFHSEEGGGESGGGSSDGKEEGDIEKALHLDGRIPPTSDRFLKQVSSRAYDMRRRLEQTIDTSSYDDAALQETYSRVYSTFFLITLDGCFDGIKKLCQGFGVHVFAASWDLHQQRLGEAGFQLAAGASWSQSRLSFIFCLQSYQVSQK